MKSIIKKSIYAAGLVAMMTGATSCNDWLAEDAPGSTKLEDFYVSGAACIQNINGAYTPLAWDYGTTYFCEWYIGDIASDDALKGGQDVTDGQDAYDIDNFKTNSNNTILRDYYRAKFDGIARCNQVLQYVSDFEPDDLMDADRKECLLGEAHFLRAFYYFQLVKVFGGVPLVDFVIDSSDRWQQPRATVDEIYDFIIKDLQDAEQMLWPKEKYADEDLGRATKGAACAMLAKVYLYRHDYDNAYTWGKKFVDDYYRTGKYGLFSDYAENFCLSGENGIESVFEIQYMEDSMSDYGGFGFTRGTFGTILTRPRFGSFKGWGFDHPTQNLYDEFEEGDRRREVTIGVPDEADAMDPQVNYLGSSPYWNNKTAMAEHGEYPSLSHDSRSPHNYRLVRVSDVLLIYAEAALESGKDLTGAKWALEEVRGRARAYSGSATALPAFPNYRGYSDNTESLRDAIRHERRVELAMEGHRWFDLVRWGIAAQVLDKDNGSYSRTETAEVRAEMATFIPGKHELFPIPMEEIILNPMDQNPGY